MLITSYGINIEGSGGGEKRRDGLFETVKKHEHFIRGKPPRRGESMSSNKSSPRLHHILKKINNKKKSHRMKKKILNTLKIRFIFFFSSVEQKNNSSTLQGELRLSRAPRLRSEFLLPASTQFTASPASQDVMLPSGAAL